MNIKSLPTMRRLSQSALLIVTLLLANISYAENVSPQVLLEQVTNSTFFRIKAEQSNITSNPDHLRVIIEEELMPAIDYKFAAFKVLGKHFRSVPKTQIPEFVEEFRQYLISNFAVALANYGGQQLIFEPIKTTEGLKNMTVKAIIRDEKSPDIHINFKLRKNKKTQEWKTYDLVAEGISLLSSKQSEFAPMIRQQGIQAVINAMKNQNKEPLTLVSNN